MLRIIISEPQVNPSVVIRHMHIERDGVPLNSNVIIMENTLHEANETANRILIGWVVSTYRSTLNEWAPSDRKASYTLVDGIFLLDIDRPEPDVSRDAIIKV